MQTRFLALGLLVLLGACGGGSSESPAPVSSTPAPVSSAVTTPAPAVSIPSASYAAGSAELGAWNVLQQARVLCGFGALQQSTQLDAAEKAHAQYLTSAAVSTGESLLSHYETDRNNSYYTGYYPWDRARYQGYGSQVAEILEATVWRYDVRNPPTFPTLQQRGEASMLSLMTTVYHLIGAMYEGTDVGFGTDIRTAVDGNSRREEYRFGSLNGYQTTRVNLGNGKLVTYPCEGSRNIPVSFVPANETPNPFPAMTGSNQQVGPPIYLKVDAGQVLKLDGANLNGAGSEVAATLLTQANDPHQVIEANEAFVVPTRVLAPDTTYQVNLSGSIDGRVFSRSFTMRTGA